MRTLRLTERRSREVRLPRYLAAQLATEFGQVIDVVPSLDRGGYRLTPRGRVGSISLPGLRVEIRPKVPLQTLFDLLNLPDERPEFDESAASTPPGLLDLFAGRLALLMRQAAVEGLTQRYLERDASVPYLRGRLDIAEQARLASRPADSFFCRFDELTVDHPENQFPKACAVGLLDAGGLSLEVEARLCASLPDFASVTALPLDHPSFGLLPKEDRTDLICLCHWIAMALAGNGPSFLLDLEQIFERFLTTGLATELAEFRVEAQVTARIGTEPELSVSLRPDIVIFTDGSPSVILDAKWKRFSGAPEPDDLHQILAYQAIFGASDVRLVYPGSRNTEAILPLPNGAQLVIHTLRVTGGREGCRAALRRLARSVRRGIRSDSSGRNG